MYTRKGVEHARCITFVQPGRALLCPPESLPCTHTHTHTHAHTRLFVPPYFPLSCHQRYVASKDFCSRGIILNSYLLGSVVAALSADYVWKTTAEGDYVVMLLQTARFLYRSFEAALARGDLPGLTVYMRPFADPG